MVIKEDTNNIFNENVSATVSIKLSNDKCESYVNII